MSRKDRQNSLPKDKKSFWWREGISGEALHTKGKMPTFIVVLLLTSFFVSVKSSTFDYPYILPMFK